ncbi:unnamed protein product [Heligmosomoides polygyrus]|uniref:DDE_3 domain-containing protein n=1 Tax=Heligmosomoides polygyrus TaxID=6339 RepID=A0A183GQH3_HELPZ|nr:unnamed protein product [Heligmosomoides polygyrus]
MDSIVVQDEKYVFCLAPSKQRDWVRSVYWKLFSKSATMDSKAMLNEIEEMGRRLALIRFQRFKKVFLFDNAASHRTKLTTDKFAQLGYVHMPHSLYLLEISPCE